MFRGEATPVQSTRTGAEKDEGREALHGVFSVFCALGGRNDLMPPASEGVKFTIYYVSFFFFYQNVHE